MRIVKRVSEGFTMSLDLSSLFRYIFILFYFFYNLCKYVIIITVNGFSFIF